MSPDEMPEELLKDLSNSEKRLTALFEKRDHFNDESKVIREMRDDLHLRRKRILDQLSDLRDKKGQLLEEMKAAKARRDLYNQKARNLRGVRKEPGNKETIFYEDINTIDRDLKKLEEEYQTRSHSLEKERGIVKAIDEKRRKLKELKAKEPEFKAERVQAETADDEIKEYRKLADQEHQKVQEIFEKLRDLNDQLDEFRPSLDHLRSEADKRHEEYLKVRKQADSYHQKATELREKVLQLRGERDRIRRESKVVIDEQNKMVSRSLDDEGKLDEAAEKAVEMLLKKGKISL